MSANQVVLYFDKQEDALLFTVSCQFGYVSRRAGPPERRSRQGCGRDLQSQSNHG